MVSANGFSCVKAQYMVTCQGQFPGLPGVLSASGTYGVQITYDVPVAGSGRPPLRYLFDSTTGCLMQISLKTGGEAIQAQVKNASGRSQTFALPAGQSQAMAFCKSP
jgi:hypothetical protein